MPGLLRAVGEVCERGIEPTGVDIRPGRCGGAPEDRMRAQWIMILESDDLATGAEYGIRKAVPGQHAYGVQVCIGDIGAVRARRGCGQDEAQGQGERQPTNITHRFVPPLCVLLQVSEISLAGCTQTLSRRVARTSAQAPRER